MTASLQPASGPRVEGLVPVHDSSRIQKIVIVRSKGRGDPVVRLTSDPILLGLRGRPGLQVDLHVPGQSGALAVEGSTCLVFHFHDHDAIAAIRNRVPGPGPVTVVCLGSDIYNYAHYLALHDLVDLYTMPTEVHRVSLACQVYKPVYILPECYDPAALGCHTVEDADRKPHGGFPSRQARRACWFGYSESFSKGMSSLMPLIEAATARGSLDDFRLIVDRRGMKRLFGDAYDVPMIEYDLDGFAGVAAGFDYAILSHFSLDLSLNSYIKSANKAVAALLAGMVPLCSDTPNYRALLEAHGLERFLFGSTLEFDRLLTRLDPVADSQAIAQSGIVESLRTTASQATAAATFLDILARHRATPPDDHIPKTAPPVMRPDPNHLPGLTDHLKDLVPSAIRLLKRRLSRDSG